MANALDILRRLNLRLTDCGYSVSTKPSSIYYLLNRLGGWLHQTYGTLNLAYEANSQDADRHLTLAQLRGLGPGIIFATTDFLSDHPGVKWMAHVDQVRRQLVSNWKKYGGTLTPAQKANALLSEATVRQIGHAAQITALVRRENPPPKNQHVDWLK